MLKKIEIHTYTTQSDHVGDVTRAGENDVGLSEEIRSTGYKGVAPSDQCADLEPGPWHHQLTLTVLVHGNGVPKGTTLFVWK